MTPRHPAPYPKYVLDRLGMWLNAERRGLGRPLDVLDPFAGTGRIHDLPRRICHTVGVELEPEWANMRPGTIVGDATALPAKWTDRFDAVVSSPCYGSRMADHHEAKDSCPECVGTGAIWTEDGCPDAPWLCPACKDVACKCGGIGAAMKAHVSSCGPCRMRRCKACGGSGLSRRYTYRHALGRMPSPGSAATLHWPSLDYQTLHKGAWAEAFRVLRPGGMVLVNVKNHLRGDVEQYVTEWHAATLREVGFVLGDLDRIPAPGLRHGANAGKRVTHEQIIPGRKPANRQENQ